MNNMQLQNFFGPVTIHNPSILDVGGEVDKRTCTAGSRSEQGQGQSRVKVRAGSRSQKGQGM